MKIKILIVLFLYVTVAFSQVTSEEILLRNDSILLAGTLTYTNSVTPLIIWVHGSGNVDRNGNQAGVNVKANYIKQFRDSITKNKIAFYSFDKRTANPKNKPHLSNTLYDDLVNDLRIVVNHFKDDKRFSGITLIGHSQGSLIALLASQHIEKYISLAGPSKSIDFIIEEQVAKNSPMVLDTVKGHFKELRETGDIKYMNPLLVQIFSRKNLPFLKSWMHYSPVEEIKKLTIPTLVVIGTKDLQVTVQDARDLHKANPIAELVIIENMNHVLKNIEKDEDNLKSYYSSDFSLSEKLIETVITFIKK